MIRPPNLENKDPKNYCLISLLQLPAKILERHLNGCFMEFVENQGQLSTSQFGFRKYHGTETPLVAATDCIRRLLDEEQGAALILLDLSAAYDMSPTVPIERLQEMGITDRALALLTFLKDCSQRVMLNLYHSDVFSLLYGVPQGSSLKTTLCNLYISLLATIARFYGLYVISLTTHRSLCRSLRTRQLPQVTFPTICLRSQVKWKGIFSNSMG